MTSVDTRVILWLPTDVCAHYGVQSVGTVNARSVRLAPMRTAKGPPATASWIALCPCSLARAGAQGMVRARAHQVCAHPLVALVNVEPQPVHCQYYTAMVPVCAAGSCNCHHGYIGPACDQCDRNHVSIRSLCVFLPGAFVSCGDGVRNGNEEGVDCGGPHCSAQCPPSTQYEPRQLIAVLGAGLVVACVAGLAITMRLRRTKTEAFSSKAVAGTSATTSSVPESATRAAAKPTGRRAGGRNSSSSSSKVEPHQLASVAPVDWLRGGKSDDERNAAAHRGASNRPLAVDAQARSQSTAAAGAQMHTPPSTSGRRGSGGSSKERTATAVLADSSKQRRSLQSRSSVASAQVVGSTSLQEPATTRLEQRSSASGDKLGSLRSGHASAVASPAEATETVWGGRLAPKAVVSFGSQAVRHGPRISKPSHEFL